MGIKLVPDNASTVQDDPREMGLLLRARELAFQISRWWLRHVPRLVWHGQEVYVRVTFTDLGLGSDNPFQDPLYIAEDALLKLGVHSDRGSGPSGRDWEWDWSLTGPIKVTFVNSRKKRKEASSPAPELRVIPKESA